jgi:DNA-binding MarR family transcriptional regulator
MGTTVAALEKAGIVERKPHPTDGRQVNIELTAKGATLRKSAKDAKLAWLVQVIAQLDEEQQKTLFAAGGIIKRLAES